MCQHKKEIENSFIFQELRFEEFVLVLLFHVADQLASSIGR